MYTDELGRRLTPKASTNAFYRLAKKAGVKTTSLHSMRHTMATTAIRNGVDIVTVAKMLGQANPTVAHGVYSHLVEGAEGSANDFLSGWLDDAYSATEAKRSR